MPIGGGPSRAGSAALVVLVLLGGLVSNTTSHPSREVRVGGTGTTVAFDATTTTTVAPSTTLPTPAAGHDGSSTADGSTRSGERAAGVPGSGEVAGTQVRDRESATRAPSAEPAPANGSMAVKPPSQEASTDGAVASTSASASTPSSPAPQTTSFDGEGGTVEVSYTDSSMSLGAVSPSPGWSVAQTRLDGSDIVVSFVSQSGGGDSDDVKVHLDGGAPVVDSPPDTAPAADQLPGG